jgi:hypothetical protein
MADNLRSMVMVKPKIEREAFPHATQISGQCIFENFLGDKPGEVIRKPVKKGPEFEEELTALAKKRSYYFAPRPDGRIQKRPGKGLLDSFISCPPWWTKALAEQLEKGALNPNDVRQTLGLIGTTLVSRLARRTKYEAVYFSTHPDSTNNLHFHLGLASISDENKLIGRSAGGKAGKKGLRNIGNCDLAMYRMSQIQPSPRNAMALKASTKKDFDDIWLSNLLIAELESRFPALKPRAQELAVEHVQAWEEAARDRTAKETPTERELLRAENRKLKTEVKELRTENQDLRAENERLTALVQSEPEL